MTRRARAFLKKFIYDGDAVYAGLNPPGKFIRLTVNSVIRFCNNNDIIDATALTFVTLLSIVPLLALAFGVAKGFDFQEDLKIILSEKMAAHKEILQWFYSFADAALANTRGGIIAGAGVIVLMFAVLSLSANIRKSFNLIWAMPRREKKKSPVKSVLGKFFSSISLLVLIPLLMLMLSGIAPLLNGMLAAIETDSELAKEGMSLLTMATDLLPPVTVCLIFALVFFLVPEENVKFVPALTGGLVTGILFLLLQNFLINFQSVIFRYNSVYGSFAAIPILLIWMKLSWMIVLFGAEFTYTCQYNRDGMLLRGGMPLAHALRRKYQLMLLKLVYANFTVSGRATTRDELLGEIKMDNALATDLILELTGNGILFSHENGSGETEYSPNNIVVSGTVCQVLRKLDGAGAPAPKNCALVAPAVEDICRGLNADTNKSAYNLTFKDLATK